MDFVKRVIKHVEGGTAHYGTSARMKGMLSVASEVVHAMISFDFGNND